MPEHVKFWEAVKIDLEANSADSFGIASFIKHWLFNPCFRVLFNYRITRYWGDKTAIGRLISRVFWANSAFNCGCDISPLAVIEPGVILLHASGIVIGEGVTIKKGARLFQRVTVGTNNWREDVSGAVVEENATLYAGCVIAGSHRIGKGASVGANAVVLGDVRAGESVVGAPARAVKSKTPKAARPAV